MSASPDDSRLFENLDFLRIALSPLPLPGSNPTRAPAIEVLFQRPPNPPGGRPLASSPCTTMFWQIPNLSSPSRIEFILDKEIFTLEELLDEEEVIQECKALNTRLISFLRERAQVEQLLQFIIEDAPEDADNKRAFKFPFIACEIFTCEVDVILKTLVEDEELMNMLFSFLDLNHTYSSILAGYFSKVAICLMSRKMTSLMKYGKPPNNVAGEEKRR